MFNYSPRISKWHIPGKLPFLDRMLSKIQALLNKVQAFYKNQVSDNCITCFINFTHENIRKSIFNHKLRYINVALCINSIEYNIATLCCNRYNESFDLILNIENMSEQEIFNAIAQAYQKKYNIMVNIKDMKFDYIIMNPPYSRNLHLKILAEAIKHLKDENSVCVNLSPDSWITNPFKMFEKEKEKREAPAKIGKYIISHESISQEDFNSSFGTNNFFGVGIAAIGTKETGFDCSKWNSTNSLLLKILEKTYKMSSLRSKFSRRVNDAKFVPVRRRTHKTYNYCEIDSNDIDAKDGILFNTEIEALNFKKSIIDTWLYQWLDKSEWTGSENSANAPWLGDCINPRTGKKGYEGEWTDDDLYKLFNLTKDEIKIIENAMKKYAAK